MNSRSFTVCVLAHFICLLNQMFESSCQPLHFHHKRMIPFGKDLNESRGLETELNSASLQEATRQASDVHDTSDSAHSQRHPIPASSENYGNSEEDEVTSIQLGSENHAVYNWDTGEYEFHFSDSDREAIDNLPEFDDSDGFQTRESSQDYVHERDRHSSLNEGRESETEVLDSDAESIASSSLKPNQPKSLITWAPPRSGSHKNSQKSRIKHTAFYTSRQPLRDHNAVNDHRIMKIPGRGVKRQNIGVVEELTSRLTRAKASQKPTSKAGHQAESKPKVEPSSNSDTETDTTD